MNKMISWRPENFCTADKALELAGFKKGSRILDIGCGDGDIVAYLARKCGMLAEGIDMNLSAVRQLEEIGYRISSFEDIDVEPDERVLENGKNGIGYFMMVAEKPL